MRWTRLRAPSSSSPTPPPVVPRRRRSPTRPSSCSEGRAARPSSPPRGSPGSRRCPSTRRRTTRGRPRSWPRRSRSTRQPERPLQPRLLRGACRAPDGRARAPHPLGGARPAGAGLGERRLRPRLDPRRGRLPDAARLLSGRVGPELGPCDQSRLLGRLEPGSLRRPKRRAGPLRQRAEPGLAEITVVAGIFPPLRHCPGATILGIRRLGVKRCRDEKHAISGRFLQSVDRAGN